MTPDSPQPQSTGAVERPDAPIKKGTELLKRLETTSAKTDSDKVGSDVRRHDD